MKPEDFDTPPEGQSERRVDDRSRSRVAALEHRVRRALRLVLVALVLQPLFVLGGFALLQDQRIDALEDACKRDNRQARGLRAVVVEAGPEFRALVARTFPIEPDCRKVARERSGAILRLPLD